MLAAGGDGGSDDEEDDPIFGKKKGKGRNGKKNQAAAAGNDDNRRQRGGNKKGKKNQQQETTPVDGQDEEEEKKEAEPAAATIELTYPLDMVYCGRCGFPPEYCEWSPRGNDLVECKKWLAENHEELFNTVYPPVEGEEGKEDGKKRKKMKGPKKVGFVTDGEKKIRVIKLSRGGKKAISSIVGMEAYGCDLADCAKILSRKLGSGAAAMLVEY